MKRRLPTIVLISLFTLGLWSRLNLIASDADAIVRVVPDDAFYYLTVARHIAAGEGSTFDGVHPTNGYHPLWMLMLVPAAGLDTDSFVRFALVLGVLLNIASALILYKVLRHIGRSVWLAVFGAGLYFVWSPVVTASLNGLETSLATTLFAAAFYTLVLSHGRSIRYEFMAGSLLAMLFLSRTDTVFYIAAFGLIVVARATPGYRLWRAVVVGGTALIGVTPWLAWNWLNFRSIIQSSGMAAPYVLHGLYDMSGHSVYDGLAQSWLYFVSYVLVGGPFLWIALVDVVTFIWAERIRHHTGIYPAALPRRVLSATLLLWLAGFGLIFVHAFIRWYPRSWYFNQLSWLSVLSVCLIIEIIIDIWLHARFARRQNLGWRMVGRVTALIGCTTALLVAVSSIQLLVIGVYPWQVEMLDGARWLAANTSMQDTAAAFNAGIISYFSGRRVVNLDGVINNAAFEALQQRDLMGFVRQSDVRYFVDYDPIMLREYQPFLGEWSTRVSMVPMATIDRPEFDYRGNHIQVYQLSWP